MCVLYAAESSEKTEAQRTPDSELAHLVDGILEDNDHNRDGFIDYTEFMSSQQQWWAGGAGLLVQWCFYHYSNCLMH